jgi:hypothetical protein
MPKKLISGQENMKIKKKGFSTLVFFLLFLLIQIQLEDIENPKNYKNQHLLLRWYGRKMVKSVLTK